MANRFRPYDYDQQEVDGNDPESLRSYARHILLSNIDPTPAQLKRVEAINAMADDVEKRLNKKASVASILDGGPNVTSIADVRIRLTADRAAKREPT